MTAEELTEATTAYQDLLALQTYRDAVDAESDGSLAKIRSSLSLIPGTATLADAIKMAVLGLLDDEVALRQAAFDAL